MDLQTIFQSEDFNYIVNTLIGLIFIFSLFTAIQAIGNLKRSGQNPAKRTEAINGIKKSAVFFFIDGILTSVLVSDFLMDLLLKSTIFETDSVKATNSLFELLMFLVRLGIGLTFISIVGAIILGFVNLAVSADNPKLRKDSLKGLLWSFLAIAILGSITVFALFFIKIGNIGGV